MAEKAWKRRKKMNMSELFEGLDVHKLIKIYLKSFLSDEQIRQEIKDFIDITMFNQVALQVNSAKWTNEEELQEALTDAIWNTLNKQLLTIASGVSDELVRVFMRQEEKKESE